MTIELKTNTAVRIPVGPLVNPTDGKTAEIALDVTALSVQIYQIKTDGSAVVRSQFSPTVSGGNNDMVLVPSSTDAMYDLELTAVNINFYGNARLSVYDVDGFLVWWVDIQVVSANYFNNKFGTTIETVNTIQIEGTDATDVLGSAQTGDAYAVVNSGIFGNSALKTLIDVIDGIVDAILVDTGVTIPGLIGALNDISAAQVNAECDTALSDYDGPTNAEMIARTLISSAYTIVADLGVVQTSDHTAGISAIFGIVNDGTFGNAAIRARGDVAWLTGAGGSAPTVEQIAAEVWNSLISGFTTAGTFGAKNQNVVPSEILNDYKAIGFNTVVPDPAGTAAGLHATTDALIDAIGAIVVQILEDTGTTIPGLINNLNDITVQDIIDGISEGTFDLQDMIRIMFSVLSGLSNGGGTNSLGFRDVADTKERLSETVDINGNRTSVTRDGS